jgi:hypothetical protein
MDARIAWLSEPTIQRDRHISASLNVTTLSECLALICRDMPQ